MYRILFEKATLPVLIIDAEGRILFANRGFEHLLGYAPGECLDLYLRDFCLPYERDRFIFSNLGKLAETMELDLDLKDKHGQSITANIILSPFERRTRPHLLLIFRDVTGKRTQEGQLRDSEERYRRLLAERDNLEAQLKRSIKLACLGELAAGIAHEVNNPLGIILGFSQDILDEIDQDHPLWESIKIIEQETARCVGVVQNLLELARPNPPQVMEVNLAQLVEDSVGLLLPRIKSNKIHVKYNLDDHPPAMRLDPQMIQQALLNLLINAIQSMPLGGELTLGLGHCAEPAESMICITITDTGHGIAAEHQSRIFEPFFSTKGSKGTGLGLAISQRIIENHGGRIEITSQEGAGTTCAVLLPQT
ncbi:MAG: PAS domain S-box protein [Desulfobacterales bacterium]|nr:PAS domain S-box protein [Desulfobacterales bacterium]